MDVAALPSTLWAFDELGVEFLSGEISVIAGKPGHGKSTLALHIALKSKAPTLYFCADSAETTMRERLLAMVTGKTINEIKQKLGGGKIPVRDPQTGRMMFASLPINRDGFNWAGNVLRETADHITWVWDSSPSLADIDMEIDAYEEIYGEYPALIVIDNLQDVRVEGENEFNAIRKTILALKERARGTNAVFLLLHHVALGAQYEVCPPSKEIFGKSLTVPALALTIHKDEEVGSLGIASVKNRHGAASDDGTKAVWVSFSPETMQIQDYGERR